MAFFMLSANAQFVEIDGKTPVFHIKFDSLTTDDTRLFNAGTDQFSFTKSNGTEVNDTSEGHGWGGGLWSGFVFQNQEIIENITLPTMFWNSYLSYPNRPQGIAAYSRSNGGYMGPFKGEAMTVAFYVNVTDSARSDTANGSWDNPYLYGCGNWAVAGERIYCYFDPSVMKLVFNWGGGNWSATAENTFAKNKWVHIAFTVPAGGERSVVKLYINGVETFFDDEAGDMTVINLTPENEGWDGIRVGALSNIWMADYRVYDQTLTASEIAKFVEGIISGINNTINKTNFTVYPVPNNGVFTIEFEDADFNEITINNIVGQIVYNELVEQKRTISLSHLNAGIYFVNVRNSKNEISSQKIVVE
jgi:hypothetical protein